MLILDVITLTVAGSLLGNEFAIAAFIHPALYRLPDGVHLVVAPALARLLGKAMPVWYILTVLLVGADAWTHRHVPGFHLILWSAALWILAIVFTLVAEVPINNRIASWVDQPAPSNWRSDRLRWDSLHRWRVLLLTAAFVLLALGVL